MVRAVGIDPGTRSMDIFGFDDSTGEILIDEAVPREEVTKRPALVLDIIRKTARGVGKIDAIVGPSGYGMPLKKAHDATDSEIMLATFITRDDAQRGLKIVSLRELMFLMREAGDLDVWFTPGVIHLPTVPAHRKINRIDMGTADKVFSAVLAVKDQAERHDIDYAQTSLILVEVGFAYTAAIAVDGCRIVDGVGGTTGGVGYLGMGAMDAELAYALSNVVQPFSKQLLFSGGAASVAGIDPTTTTPEAFIELAKKDSRARMAYETLIESILKDVTMLLTTLQNPTEIILSGRFVRMPDFLGDLMARLTGFLEKLGVKADVRTIGRRAHRVKEGAEGAAVLANGIAGGEYSRLVEVMGLEKSKGTILDHIYLEKEIVQKLRETYSQKT